MISVLVGGRCKLNGREMDCLLHFLENSPHPLLDTWVSKFGSKKLLDGSNILRDQYIWVTQHELHFFFNPVFHGRIKAADGCSRN